MTQAPVTAKSAIISTRHVVELRDVSMRFGGKQVLDNVSLVIDPQERLVIIGQSGAGKTTILRLVLGVLKPNKGSVFFNRHKVSQMNDHELEAVRMRMGMVYQDAALLSSLTERENLALPLQELTNKTPAEIDKLVDEKLEMVQLDQSSLGELRKNVILTCERDWILVHLGARMLRPLMRTR